MCMFCSSIFVHTLSIPYLFSMSVFWFFSSPYLYPIYTPCPFSGIFLLPIYTLSIPYLYSMFIFWYFSSPYLYPIYTPGPFSGIFLHPIYTLSILQARFLVFFFTLSIPYLYPIYIFIYIALKSHSSRICSSNVWPYIYYNSFSFFETAHFI